MSPNNFTMYAAAISCTYKFFSEQTGEFQSKPVWDVVTFEADSSEKAKKIAEQYAKDRWPGRFYYDHQAAVTKISLPTPAAAEATCAAEPQAASGTIEKPVDYSDYVKRAESIAHSDILAATRLKQKLAEYVKAYIGDVYMIVDTITEITPNSITTLFDQDPQEYGTYYEWIDRAFEVTIQRSDRSYGIKEKYLVLLPKTEWTVVHLANIFIDRRTRKRTETLYV